MFTVLIGIAITIFILRDTGFSNYFHRIGIDVGNAVVAITVVDAVAIVLATVVYFRAAQATSFSNVLQQCLDQVLVD